VPPPINRPWIVRLASAVPEWLQNRPAFQVGYKILWSFCLFLDRSTQVALEGVRAGWPGYDGRTDNSSLLGTSRDLLQGETETTAAFQARLRNWITLSTELGGDPRLVSELSTYIGNNPTVRMWTRNGRCTSCVGGVVSRVTGVNGGWSGPGALSGLGLNWDSLSNPERAQYWWDCWIVICPSEMPPAGTIAGRLTPSGGTESNIPAAASVQGLGIGHLVTQAQVSAMKGLIHKLKGQHVNIRLVVWTNDTTLFDPANPMASGNPNGLWGRGSFWGLVPSGTVGSGIGQWPSRNRNCRYWNVGT
jgi:hypothetical protein